MKKTLLIVIAIILLSLIASWQTEAAQLCGIEVKLPTAGKCTYMKVQDYKVRICR